MPARAAGHRPGGTQVTAALSLEDRISVAEQVMERSGLAGRTVIVPEGHQDDPAYRAAISPLEEWCSKVTGTSMLRRVYTSAYTLRAEGNPQALVTASGSIVVAPVTNEMTLLHECAHLITRTTEGRGGHTPAFVQTVQALYAEHLGPEAAAAFTAALGQSVASLSTTAADSADTEGVMVCFDLRDSPTTKVLTDLDETDEPVENAHVTLFYLGSTADVGGPLGRERLYRACYDFAIHGGYSEVSGSVNGLGTFSNPDSHVLWAVWDIPGIAEFRASLGTYLASHGVPMRDEDHGFTPHQTLAYSDDPITSLPLLPASARDKVTFGAITISWGEEWQDVPFA